MSSVKREVVTFGTLGANQKNAMVGGPFGSNLVSDDYTAVGIPVIRGQNLGQGRWVGGDFVFVSETKASSLRSNWAAPGDVVFTQRGTLGQVAIVPQGPWNNYLISQSQMKATIDQSKADPVFIYYLFTSPAEQQYIIGNAVQAGVPHINLTQLRSHPISIPPLEEQRAIALILGRLDDKIEQNQRMARKLERLARAIFRAWFVDFEPVKAKAAGATSFPSMPQSVFDVLPTHFVDSDIGPVPQGWRASTVADCASYVSRGISPKYIEDDGILVVNQRCIRDFKVDFGNARRHNHRARSVDGRQLEIGDVLINSTGVGTLGRTGQIRSLPGRAIADSHVTVLRTGAGLSHAFWGQALMARQSEIEAMGEGTTGQTELSRHKLLRLPLLLPIDPVDRAFAQVADPFLSLAEVKREESTKLANMRDYLLPRLLEGKLQVQHEGSGSTRIR